MPLKSFKKLLDKTRLPKYNNKCAREKRDSDMGS